jgi:tetratricopeptide (TPR) repeat protein
MDEVLKALVRIERDDGTVVGNGFLHSSGRVVTCAHVVANCLGGTERDLSAPKGEMNVCFFRREGRPTGPASVAPGGWFPDHDDAGADGLTDIAILALAEPASGVTGLTLATSRKESFETRLHPFLPSLKATREIKGSVSGVDSDVGKRTIEARNEFTQFVKPGCSGTPVFVLNGEQVEGIVEIRDTTILEALFSPASAIRKAIESVRAHRVAQDAGLNEKQASSILASILGAFGTAGVPFEQAEALLVKKAEELKAFRDRLAFEIRNAEVHEKILFAPASATSKAIKAIVSAIKRQAGSAAGLNEQQAASILTSILGAFGEKDLPSDQAQALLIKKAEELKALRDRLAALSTEDPRLRPFRDKAQAALAEGRFDEAAAALAEAEAVVDSALHELEDIVGQRKREKARLREGQGDAKRLGLAYLDAARLYRAAADLLPPSDREEWARLRFTEGDVLDDHGRSHPGLQTLRDAVAAYDATLTVRTRDAMPADWAMTQNNRAVALQTLGDRQGGEAGLQALRAAVAACDDALTVYTRDAMPADWAMTQNNRAIALRTLGQRQGGAAGLQALRDAVAAYDAALTVHTREAMPADWAMTQNNRAIALRTLGERQGGEAGLQALRDAVAAYDAALTVHTREAMPAQWAMTKENIAIAWRSIAKLTTLGERRAALDRALVAVDAALSVYRTGGMEYNTGTAERLRARILDAMDSSKAD